MDMTKGSPTSLLLRFAMPLFLGNLLQQFYNLVDTSIAGNLLGDGALAQIGATAALYSLITNFAFGMNNGLALGVSRNFGAGDQQGVKKSVCWMTCLSCFCSVVLTVAFLIFRKGLLQVMQIPDDVMDGALRYLSSGSGNQRRDRFGVYCALLSGTVLYSRTGAWNQHGDLCQPELWGGPGKKNPQRLSDSNSSVWDLVDHCTYVYFYPGTGSDPASYRKQQPGGDL